jgi:DICT domain-containing protein
MAAIHPISPNDLQIKDVAELTGLTSGTIRAWEQRFGFPVPARTNAGYRQYTQDDVEALRRVIAYRRRGLSVAAAIERAQESGEPSDRPSIYAAVVASDPASRPQVLRKSSLVAISRAIEHETLARAAEPVLFATFQYARFFRAVEPRYRRLAAVADVAAVFADFDAVSHPDGGPAQIPIGADEALGNEWAVIVDAPGYAACLLAWEHPSVTRAGGVDDLDRRFEAVWTLDAYATRRAATVAAQLVRRVDPDYGARCLAVLADRPLAVEAPAPGLTALANRVVAYLEDA